MLPLPLLLATPRRPAAPYGQHLHVDVLPLPPLHVPALPLLPQHASAPLPMQQRAVVPPLLLLRVAVPWPEKRIKSETVGKQCTRPFQLPVMSLTSTTARRTFSSCSMHQLGNSTAKATVFEFRKDSQILGNTRRSTASGVPTGQAAAGGRTRFDWGGQPPPAAPH